MTSAERIDARARELYAAFYDPPGDYLLWDECGPQTWFAWRRLARLTFKMERDASYEHQPAGDARWVIRRAYPDDLLPENEG